MPANTPDRDPALGIPQRGVRGNPERDLSPGELVTYVLQHHRTARNPTRPHYDLRLGTPDTGLFSWAVPGAELPAAGQRKLAPQTEVHRFGYGTFQGKIGPGYGAGQVRRADMGEALITKTTPNTVSFTLAHGRVPMRYSLIRMDNGSGRDWLLISRPTVRTDVPGIGDKPTIKRIEAADLDTALAHASEVQEKIDGAQLIYDTDQQGRLEAYSVRPRATGEPIVHTERLGLAGTKLKGVPNTTFRAEGFGVDQATGKAIPFKDLSGILNMGLAKSVRAQKDRGIALRGAPFQMLRYRGKPTSDLTPEENRALIEKIMPKLPADRFYLPERATDPAAMRALIDRIQAGKQPTTDEGVMIQTPEGLRKYKIRQDATVYLQGSYPGEGRRAQTAGGLLAAMEPGGEPNIRVGTGFTDADLADILARMKELKGQPMRVGHYGQFGSGKLRAPSFQGFETDKSAQALRLQPGRRPPIRLQGAPTASNLYDAVAKAETGIYPDPFIRTKYQPRGGSTAYGPVQITGSLLKDYAASKLFDPAQRAYIQRLLEQAKAFNQNGGNKGKYPYYNPQFDYGGTGSAARSPADRQMYRAVTEKIIQDLFKKNGGNLQQFIKRWRGVGQSADPRYYKAVQDALPKPIKGPSLASIPGAGKQAQSHALNDRGITPDVAAQLVDAQAQTNKRKERGHPILRNLALVAGAGGLGLAGAYGLDRWRRGGSNSTWAEVDPTSKIHDLRGTLSWFGDQPYDAAAALGGVLGAGLGGITAYGLNRAGDIRTYLRNRKVPKDRQEAITDELRKQRLRRALALIAGGGLAGYAGVKGLRRAVGRVATNLVLPAGYTGDAGFNDEMKQYVLKHPREALRAVWRDEPLWRTMDTSKMEDPMAQEYVDAFREDTMEDRLPLFDRFFDRPMRRGNTDLYRVDAADSRRLFVNPAAPRAQTYLDQTRESILDPAKPRKPQGLTDRPTVYQYKRYRPYNAIMGDFNYAKTPTGYRAVDPWDFDRKTDIEQGEKLLTTEPGGKRKLNMDALIRDIVTLLGRPPTVIMDVPATGASDVVKTSGVKADVAQAAKQVDPKPTEAQKEVGNYQKGHVTIHGLDITIETAKGGVRSGVTADGKAWRTVMKAHYGYIKKTESEADGDHVDIFIGPDPESYMVFVIDQIKPTSGRFDEHKCVLGCHTADEAKDLYHDNYQKDWKGFKDIRALSLGEFKEWLESGDTGKPIAEQFAEDV